MSMALVAAVTTAGAVLLAMPARPSARGLRPQEPGPDAPPRGARRARLPHSLLSGVAAAWFVGGPAGPVAGVLAAVASYVVLGRSEDPVTRQARVSAEADLPALVLLLAAGLRSGAAPQTALALACGALPGSAADRLARVRARLVLGVDPVAVWEPLTTDPVLAPLARTLARAARSGARVADAVDRLSVELARQARARSEEQARSVGVRAAVPLGLCLLPAFLLLGVVPVVAGLFDTLTG
jgi:Flp pilus assembly protein TadB